MTQQANPLYEQLYQSMRQTIKVKGVNVEALLDQTVRDVVTAILEGTDSDAIQRQIQTALERLLQAQARDRNVELTPSVIEQCSRDAAQQATRIAAMIQSLRHNLEALNKGGEP